MSVSLAISPGRVNARQGDISDLNIFITPFIEQLDAADFRRDILGKNGVGATGALDLNLTVVRHVGDV